MYTKTVPRNADDLLHALPHTITYTYCTNMELVQEGARVRNSSDTAYTSTFAGLNTFTDAGFLVRLARPSQVGALSAKGR